MAQTIFDLLGSYLAHYGYVAIAVALLLENAGVPLPGETILLLASFLAYSEHKLQLPYIILVGVAAATIGDSVGYAIGYRGGRPLLDKYQRKLRIPSASLKRGEQLFARYGAATIFVARFIAGMRIFAGPMAGVLRMRWRRFFIFNFLGALLWVTVISCVGYVFGRHWETLVRILEKANLTIVVVVILGLWLWWRQRRSAG